MCKLEPSRATPLLLPDVGYVESIGAIVLASPENDGAGETFGLGCCGSGGLAGASCFFSPHIYPPWAQLRRNQLIEYRTGATNLFPCQFGAKPKMKLMCPGRQLTMRPALSF